MRKRTTICILIAVILVLLGSIYVLFFGNTGFLKAERQEVSAESSSGESNDFEEENGTRLTFSMGNDAYAEQILSREVLAAVEAINTGKSLAEATGMKELEGYFALTTTHMIIAKDEETGEEATGSGRLTIYVPNLLDGLADVSALFYDCGEEQWRVIPAEVVDTVNKRISVTLNGSGVMTTIYRLE